MKRVGVAALLAAAVSSCCVGAAQAAVVIFSGLPAISWADGVFSHNLSGDFPDGFYAQSPTSAVNGFGQDHEFIRFNNAVTLNSLSIGKCQQCFDSQPSTFTVNLYNAGASLVGTQTVTASSTPQTLAFDTGGVQKVEFTFDGITGSNPYEDGRKVAWYEVSDVTYTAGVVEPAVWALMIGGFGLAGAALRRRRQREA
jgi:hypothetical protein